MQALAKIGLVVVSTLSIVLPAQSAYMLGNPGWEPLTLDYLKAHNIDPSFMDEVLDGGGEFTCVWKSGNGAGFVSLNGWYFQGSGSYVLTNAHALYSQVDGKLREHFERCYTSSNRGMLLPTFTRYKIDPDPSTFLVGGPNPLGDHLEQDRALVPVVGGFPREFEPLKLPPSLDAITSQICGDRKIDVFLVSSGRGPTHDPRIGEIVPRIQEGKIWQLAKLSAGGDQPARLILKADWHKGDSASMVFFRDPKDPTSLVPIALFQGGVQQNMPSPNKPIVEAPGVDGLGFDPDSNFAVAILLSADFFKFDVRAKDVPVSQLPSMNRGLKSKALSSDDCIVGG